MAGARPAIVERIKIHGQALEGNLEGDAVDRDALVFLPPSYNQNRTQGAFARGAREMIYPGTHTSDVAIRFQEYVIPFFSRTLSFERAKR